MEPQSKARQDSLSPSVRRRDRLRLLNAVAVVLLTLLGGSGQALGYDRHYAYTSYVFDLLPFVTGGTTYKLRFAQVETELFFNQGVDNVSLLADANGSIPEPTTLALLGLGLLGIPNVRRKLLRG